MLLLPAAADNFHEASAIIKLCHACLPPLVLLRMTTVHAAFPLLLLLRGCWLVGENENEKQLRSDLDAPHATRVAGAGGQRSKVD